MAQVDILFYALDPPSRPVDGGLSSGQFSGETCSRAMIQPARTNQVVAGAHGGSPVTERDRIARWDVTLGRVEIPPPLPSNPYPGMSEDRHETLVESARLGDEQAIDALLERHLPGLRAYVRLHASELIREKESCSDLVQSVCREVLEGVERFEYRGEAQFRNWLVTQAMGKIVSRQRFYLAEKRSPQRERRFASGPSISCRRTTSE